MDGGAEPKGTYLSAFLGTSPPSLSHATKLADYRGKNTNTSQEIAKLDRNTEHKKRTKPKGPHKWT